MTTDVASLVSENVDIWTTAVERKSRAGRGGGKRSSLYGIDRLRELILDLAVRGKLVAQDTGDEPATELLRKIGAERAKLTKAGAIGKRKAAESNSGDAPYPIPDGWTWTRIADVGHDWGQKEPSGEFTYVDVSSIDQKAGVIRSPSVLSVEEAPSRARKVVKVGTVIYSTIRPYLLNIAIVDQEFDPEPIASTAFAVVHPFEGVTASFLYRYLRSATFISYVEDCQTGIAYPAINDKQFFSAWFPLPPIAEQKRIVAKVDELMALCDALEGESAAAIAAHKLLVETLLATLTDSADAAELASNWARFEAHFDTLFTTEASVDVLKRTILELAVRGKLVTQKSDEVPSSLLLATIKAGSDRGAKQKFHPAISAADQPFVLPDGWCWERFGNLIDPASPIAYGVLVPGADQSDGVPFVRIADLSITNPSPLPEKAISPEIDAQFARTRLVGGEILMGVVGSIGKLGVAPASWAGANIARAICRIVPSPLLNRDYVLWLLQSRFMQDSFSGDTRTLAQPTLNIGLIRLAATPVPPIAEQQRIVAKINELMTLCDAMQEVIGRAVETQRFLVDTVVELAGA
ncbi:restriction endonuclease subunit S [Lysobacter sp. D1-1-M9]|uniref:restriction endonuclease subunit S n=1 Tax=Novilysobacter longmucuonensis TaxID=3098603 RepID=UPI002FC75BD0